ncbi:unnamed protein product [Microthlaspi erraticum]|uniref:Uncharacterized protein n=1 Tax=Microthlaspi erraticum TaxID=1685480 RepID=A0A6D2HN45_9BRAS|nr:unnamed protein product [Microthlaspi erraticum]
MSPPPIHSPAIHDQCLASHFNIFPLIEKLSKEIETGSSDSLVSELKIQFENCQQMLNSISESLGSKAMSYRVLYNTKMVSHPKTKNQEEEERN